VIDGLRLGSYVLASIAMIEQYAPRGFQKEIFAAFRLVHMPVISIFTSVGVFAIENFIAINVFCQTVSCYRILGERKQMTKYEIAHMTLRKLLRVAIIYYPCWLIVYSILPWIGHGPVWEQALDGISSECDEWRQFLPTFFMVNNLIPFWTAVPFTGCFQDGWTF
jgi:hypothetical protein